VRRIAELEAAAKPSRSAPKPKPTMVLEESARNEALMRQLRAKQAEIDTGRSSVRASNGSSLTPLPNP